MRETRGASTIASTERTGLLGKRQKKTDCRKQGERLLESYRMMTALRPRRGKLMEERRPPVRKSYRK